jgi:hypothetical protein
MPLSVTSESKPYVTHSQTKRIIMYFFICDSQNRKYYNRPLGQYFNSERLHYGRWTPTEREERSL